MDNHHDDAADVLVIFGITGDLARRSSASRRSHTRCCCMPR
jgi:hypothetical protein